MSTYHYSENAISNVSLVARLVNECYTIYNIRDDNAIHVWSKKYVKHIQFPRDHKFNLYYAGINEADVDEHCCLSTVKRASECTFIVRSTIMDHYKNIHLDIDLLFVNKIPVLLMISCNIRFIHFKALLSKHNKRVQNRPQQIVQSRRFKTRSTYVDRDFENIVDWVHSNLHLDLTNYMVDSQVSITEDVIQVVNDMVKQEVIPGGIQFRNIHHELILLDLFTNNDIYDNDSYASDADWKVGKKPETHLEKIVFNIDVDNNEIDDLNDENAIHLKDGLADDNNTDIEDSGV